MERKMKDSGIPWIGEIPGDWEVCFTKQLMRNKSIKGFPDEQILSLYRDYGVVPKDSRDDNHNVTSEDTASYKLVEIGDFVINKMKAWQGSMAISAYRGIISPAYYICRFTNESVNRRYIHYLLRNETYKTEYRRLSTGLRVGQWDLNIDDFLHIPAILPPLPTQQRIANYLDRKCAEIDELAALQETMIAELKRYKQSVITEAVTGKLKIESGKVKGESGNLKVENGKMKDSGVEWIGEIPKGWEICRLKDIVGRRNEKAINSNVAYIGLEHLVGFSKEMVTTENVYDNEGANMCYANDVIFGKLRPYLGKAKVIEETCCCSSEFLVLCNAQCPNYMRYLILSGWFIEIVNASTYGTKMPRANADFILNMQVPNTPLAEQRAIADYLDRKCAEIDQLIAIKQQKIEALKEYKKSVIFEYVTGKREVER